MKSKFQFTEEADADLEDISFYTYVKWGEKKAEKYLANLKECVITLFDNSFIGKDVSYMGTEFRMFAFKSHYIFYLTREGDILIVCILGQSMDDLQHL